MVNLTVTQVVFLLLFSGILPISLCGYLWMQEDSTRVKLFVAFMANGSLWSFAYLFQLSSIWPSSVFWFKFKYIGIIIIPLAWFFFALEYVGRGKWISKRSITVLSLIPVFNLFMIWTNDLHHLFFTKLVARNAGPFLTRVGVSGILFWIHSAYSYALLLLGALIILLHLAKTEMVYFIQALILSIGILVPIIGNAVFLSNLVSLNKLDITPLLFPFTIVTFTWALSRYRFMDLIPLARELVFDKIEDPIIVLDNENKVLDVNKSAKEAVEEYFSPTRSAGLVGRKPEEIFSNDQGFINDIKSRNETRIRIETEGDNVRCFDVKIDTIKDNRGQVVGRLLLFHDITELEELKENEFLHTLLRQDLRSKYWTIQGYHQLLEEEANLPEKKGEYLRRAIRAAQGVDEILSLEKKLDELDETELVGQKNIIKVINQVIDDISDFVDEEGVEIERKFPEKIGKVKGDHSLKIIFSQILLTRIQISECTKVKIEAIGEENVLIRIDDDGGTLPDDVKNMFSGEAYTGRTTGVGGVRYYMIKQIAEHNNADINVQDSEYGGARFDIRLQNHLKKA